MRKLSSYIILAVKGMCMGAADVIPGVSGGTIAFLTGIYGKLVDSIKSIDLNAFKLLFSGKIKEFWKKINGWFLVAVFAGILASVFSIAKIMQYLLANHPIQLWSFFFGLILVSIFFIAKGIKGFKWHNAITFVAGVGIGAFICLVSPSETTNSLWFIFLCGAIAICAMILPGISGSFILLLLGKYAYIMNAVSSFDFTVLVIFAAGAVIGILSFSHLLSWLLKKCYNGTLCLLTGLMAGSLIKVWPWKEVLLSGTDRPVLPSAFVGEPLVGQAIFWMVTGAVLISVIEFVALRIRR